VIFLKAWVLFLVRQQETVWKRGPRQ
jgi:hypothetical protein